MPMTTAYLQRRLLMSFVPRKGFTLIELLVVIAIISLLKNPVLT
jgi:prepilin-type N-terminal cleavage/methylation domain-containing protein